MSLSSFFTIKASNSSSVGALLLADNMPDTQMATTRRIIRIILMIRISIPGVFLIFLSSRSINPNAYKLRNLPLFQYRVQSKM